MSEFFNWLKLIHEDHLKMRPTEIVLGIGRSVDYENNLATNRSESASFKMLQKIAEPIEIFFEWSLDGLGKIFRTQEKLALFRSRKVLLKSYPGKVSIISRSQVCGEVLKFGDLEKNIDERVQYEVKDPNAFALILEGNSMEPLFWAGDLVVFLPNSEHRNGDIVVARHLDSGSVYFKRFRRTGPEGSVAKLISTNKNYSDLEIPMAEFRFIYPAGHVIRKLRT